MKKINKLILGVMLGVMLIFGGLVPSINLLASRNDKIHAASFADGDGHGPNRSSQVVYNAPGRGTTTLFEGTSVTANGTVAGEDVSYRIYGNSAVVKPKVVTSREEYYITSNGNQWIDTGIKPNDKTTLEVSFYIPSNFPSSSSGHTTVVGACGIQPDHFGTAFLINSTNGGRSGATQHLYGEWSGNAPKLQTGEWEPNGHYYSKLVSEPGKVTAYFTDKNGQLHTNSLVAPLNLSSFNSLVMFGQNNGATGIVNKFAGGIKEVKITQDGIVVRHFFAVIAGSTEFSPVPAPSNCMFDTISGNYFENSGTGNFDTMDAGTKNEIDISTIIGGGLDGEIVANDGAYNFIDGNGDKWKADFLEVDQHYNNGTGRVRLYRYTTDAFTPITGPIAEELLGIKATDTRTVLGNDSGAWMEGVIGPIITYKITEGSTAVSDRTTLTGGPIKLLGFENLTQFQPIMATNKTSGQTITASTANNGHNGAKWLINDINFTTTIMLTSATSTSINAREVLFSRDKLLEFATLNAGEYELEIDVELIAVDMTEITIAPNIDSTAAGELGITIGNRFFQTFAAVETGAYNIKAEYDPVLYEFDTWDISGNYTQGEGFDLSNPEISIITQANQSITVRFNVVPKKYSVQILGETTGNDSISSIVNKILETSPGVEREIWYNRDTAMTLSAVDLRAAIQGEYLYESDMAFAGHSFYEFAYLEFNGTRIASDFVINLDASAFTRNQVAVGGENFIINAVYQRKFVVNVRYEFTDGSMYEYADNNYTLSTPASPNSKSFDNRITGAGDAYAINEGDTAVIILRPDKRYEVASISGDGGTAQVSPDNLRELLVIKMDKSYDIVVKLQHREIHVDFDLNITDNNPRTIEGIPQYINGGSVIDGNYTTIIRDGGSQTLVPNQDQLDAFGYRSLGFYIWDFINGEWDELDNSVLTVDDDFFYYYVGGVNESARVALFVIQQYVVDISGLGFDFISETSGVYLYRDSYGNTFTLSFADGDYTTQDNFQFIVDHGTIVSYTAVAAAHNKFVQVGGSNAATGNFTITATRTLSFEFDRNTYTFPANPTITGEATLDSFTGNFTSDSTIAFTLSPNETYVIASGLSAVTINGVSLNAAWARRDGNTITITDNAAFFTALGIAGTSGNANVPLAITIQTPKIQYAVEITKGDFTWNGGVSNVHTYTDSKGNVFTLTFSGGAHSTTDGFSFSVEHGTTIIRAQIPALYNNFVGTNGMTATSITVVGERQITFTFALNTYNFATPTVTGNATVENISGLFSLGSTISITLSPSATFEIPVGADILINGKTLTELSALPRTGNTITIPVTSTVLSYLTLTTPNAVPLAIEVPTSRLLYIVDITAYGFTYDGEVSGEYFYSNARGDEFVLTFDTQPTLVALTGMSFEVAYGTIITYTTTDGDYSEFKSVLGGTPIPSTNTGEAIITTGTQLVFEFVLKTYNLTVIQSSPANGAITPGVITKTFSLDSGIMIGLGVSALNRVEKVYINGLDLEGIELSSIGAALLGNNNIIIPASEDFFILFKSLGAVNGLNVELILTVETADAWYEVFINANGFSRIDYEGYSVYTNAATGDSFTLTFISPDTDDCYIWNNVKGLFEVRLGTTIEYATTPGAYRYFVEVGGASDAMNNRIGIGGARELTFTFALNTYTFAAPTVSGNATVESISGSFNFDSLISITLSPDATFEIPTGASIMVNGKTLAELGSSAVRVGNTITFKATPTVLGYLDLTDPDFVPLEITVQTAKMQYSVEITKGDFAWDGDIAGVHTYTDSKGNSFTLTFTDGAYFTIDGFNFSVEHGTIITRTQIPAKHNDFVGTTGMTTTSIAISAARQITFNFTLSEYTLNVESIDGNKASIDTPQIKFRLNESIVIALSPNSKFKITDIKIFGMTMDKLIEEGIEAVREGNTIIITANNTFLEKVQATGQAIELKIDILTEKVPTETPVWVYGAGGAGLLIVVGLVVLAVLLNKRSKRIEEERLKAEAKVREYEQKFNIGSMIAKLKEDPKEFGDNPKQAGKSATTPTPAPILNLDGGSILKDKTIVDKDKKKIGSLQSDGTLLDVKGKSFGKVSLETGKITDNANNVIGIVQGDGVIKKA